MDNNDLYKNRSVASVIRESYFLMLTNLRRIFSKTWLPVVALSLVGALVTFCIPDAQTLHQAPAPLTRQEAMMNIVRMVGPLIALTVGFFGVANWLTAKLTSLLNARSFRHNLRRALSCYGVLLTLFTIVGLIVFVGEMLIGFQMAEKGVTPERMQTVGRALSCGVTGVLFVVSLPLAYSAMSYIINEKTKLREILSSGYLYGLRHWGYLFTAAFLAGIISLLIILVISAPTFILSAAVSIDDYGTMIMGDESGLPSKFQLLVWMTNFITTFVLSYVGVWLFFVFYYTYGHLAAKRTAKRSCVDVNAKATGAEEDGKQR